MSCLSWRGIFHKNWEIKLKFQMGGLWRNRGPPSFFSRKGALAHHRVGTNSISFAPPQAAGLIHSVVPPFPTKSATLWEPFCGGGISCGNRALCEADAAVATASRQCHSTCKCCCHRLRDWANTVASTDAISPTACANLPPAALFAAMTRSSASGHFLFCERETEKERTR